MTTNTNKNNHSYRRALKLTALFLVFSLIFAFAACSGEQTQETTAAEAGQTTAVSGTPVSIGILQYAVHGSLDNCREGFLQGLEAAGLKEGTDFVVDYENAGADDGINQQIAANFSAKGVDMMLAIATPSATACFAAAEDKNIPVIYSAITDPQKAGLTEGNITGTSDKLPVAAQLDLIRTLQPEAKTIGIIYTLSEPNSVSAIAEYNEKCSQYGFTIEAIGISEASEIALAADTLISKKVDCFSNLTDNKVVEVLDSILEKTNAAGIPVYGSEIEQVKKGCVASAGIDYIKLGQKTGEIAAKVIKGEAKCEDIPFESITDYEIYTNTTALGTFNITIPASVADKAIEAE